MHIALHDWRALRGQADVVQNDLRLPAYLALNAEGGSAPGRRPLTEVAAILYYLQSLSGRGLLPRDDIEADAQALSWMSFTLPPCIPRAHADSTMPGSLRNADRRLGSGWALGRYSIADIHLFRLYGGSPIAQACAGNLSHLPRIMRAVAVRRATNDRDRSALVMNCRRGALS